MKLAFLALAALLLFAAPVFTQNCNANFTWMASCNSVKFTPNSIGPGIQYQWDFGVSGITTDVSTDTMPTYIYFNADSVGTYTFTVKLVIIDGNCIDTATNVISFTIGNGGLPDVCLETIGLLGEFIHCGASNIDSSYTLKVKNCSSPIPMISDYVILWGDGKSDTLNSFIATDHYYSTFGLYMLTLIATTNNGCTDSTQYDFFHGRNPSAEVVTPPSADLCVPVTITFLDSDAQLNPPGTTYYYTVIEGNGNVFRDTLYLIDSTHHFTYTFLHGSCEPGYILDSIPGFDGRFLIKVDAVNQCGSSSNLANPPFSKLGEADFEMDTLGCVDNNYQIINTSDTSYYFNSTTNTCLTEMNKFWFISGGSYTIIDGALGDAFLDETGTDSLNIHFNSPGTYSVTLVYRMLIDNPCPDDTITKTICILPAPIAGYTKNQVPPCVPAVVTLANTSNTIGNCRAANYHWDILFQGSDCGDVGAWTLLNGTDTNSITPPKIRFDNPGTYLIRLTVSNMCGEDVYEDSITIGSAPMSVITPIDDACGSLTVTPSAESVNACNGQAPSLMWIIPDPAHPFTPPFLNFMGANPPPQTYTTPGNYTITLRTIGNCATTQATETFTIFPLPAPPAIVTNSPVCEGSTLQFSISNPNPNYVYTWPEVPPVTGTTWTIPNAPAQNSTYTVTITETTSGLSCSSTQSVPVLVYSKPPLNILGDTSICAGQSTTLQAQPAGYLNYSWTASPYLDTLDGPTVVATPPVGSWEFIVTAINNSSQNCKNSDTITVTVNALPTVTIATPDTACSGIPLQLDASADHTGSGVWSPNPPVTPGGIFTANPGTYPITFTFTDDNGCVASDLSTVCVQPLPLASFSTVLLPLSQCVPVQVTTINTSNTLNSCLGADYLWQVQFDSADCHNGSGMWTFISGNANSQSPVFNFTESGTYTLTLTVSNHCGTSTATKTIQIGQAPQVQIDSLFNSCDTAVLDLNAQVSGCNSNIISMIWKVDGVPVINPNAVPVGGVGTHTVMVTVGNACGIATDMSSFEIQGTISPDIQLIDTFGCVNFTTGVINGTTGTIESLLWTISSPTGSTGASINGGANSPNPTFTFTEPGIFSLQLDASNGACGTYTWQGTVIASDAPGVTLAAVSDTCLGSGPFDPLPIYSLDTAFIDLVSWFIDGLPVPGSFFPVGFAFGNAGTHTLSVVVTNACGADTASVSYRVLLPPSAAAQLETTFTCLPDTVGVTNMSTGDDLQFQWSVSPAAQISNDTAAAPQFIFDAVGVYTISMSAFNAKCDTSYWTQVITVSDAPAVNLAAVSDTCLGSGIFIPLPTFALDTAFIDLVSWFIDGLPVPGSFFPNGFAFGNAGTHTLSVVVTNACGADTASVSYRVLLPPSAAAQLETTFTCLPDTVGVSNMSTGDDLQFQWSVSPAAQISNDTAAAPQFIFDAVGVYTVSMSAFNAKCDTSYWTQVITVSDAPAVNLAAVSDTCLGSGLFIPLPTYALDTAFIDLVSWFIDGLPVPGSFFPNGFAFGNAGTHTLSVVVTNACGADTASVSYRVLLPPSAAAQLETTFTCLPDTVGVSNMSTGDDLQFQWSVSPAAQISNDTAAAPQFIFDAVGVYTVSLSAFNAKCDTSYWTQVITVSDAPAVNLAAVSDTCLGAAVFAPLPLYILDTAFIDLVSWFIDGLPVPGSFFPNGFAFGNAGTHTLSVVVTNACGTDTASVSYRVLLPPSASAQLETTFTCLPDTVGVSNLSTGDDLQFQWSVNPAAQISNDTAAAPQFIFDAVGVYTVSLSAFNAKCDTSYWTQVIRVSDAPAVNLAAVSDTCLGAAVFAPLPLYILDTAFIDLVSWFIDGLPVPGSFLPDGFDYGSAGTHILTAVVANACGADTASVSYRVLLPPSAMAQLDTAFACLPASVGVTNLSTGDDLQFQWSVNPAAQISNDTAAAPQFAFDAVGVYTLSMSAFNAKCDTAHWTQVITISDAPNVTLAGIPDSICKGSALITPIPAYNLGQAFIDSVQWKFTGSTGIQTSSAFNPGVIPYDTSGLFFIHVTIKNRCGMSTASDTLLVIEPPVAGAGVDKTSGCAPMTVHLNSQPVSGVTYVWDFGDGSSVVMGPQPGNHQYQNAGTFVISGTATDGFGCDSTSQIAVIEVHPTPLAGFTLVQDKPCGLPQEICLLNTSAGANAYNWFFENGVPSASIQSDPCLSFPNEGTYDIEQIVSNQFGCADTTSVSFTAYDEPIASFATLDTSGCEDLLVHFQNSSLHSEFSTWQFYNLVDTTWNPVHLFTNPGTYNVSLTVGNGSGCTDTQEEPAYIEVWPTPVADFTFEEDPNAWPHTFQFQDQSITTVPLSYVWMFYDGDSAFIQNPLHRYLTLSDQVVRLWVQNQYGCTDSLVKTIDIDNSGDLFVPNVLEPDNSNPERKVFLPKGYNLEEYHIAVFTRTGQLVWESKALENGHPKEGWDGTLNGVPLQSGVFAWKVITARFTNHREWDGMLDENAVKRKSNFLYLLR